MDDFDGVRPRLPANFEGHGRLAIQPRDGTLLFGAIFDAADVANLDRRPVDVRHNKFFHVARVRVAAQRAEDEFAPAGFDIAAGHVRILALQSIAHRRNRNLVSRQPLSVDPDIDRAIETAHDIDCANATRSLELYFDDLVGVLSQLANRTLTGKRDRQYRRAVVIELHNDGWFCVGR